MGLTSKDFCKQKKKLKIKKIIKSRKMSNSKSFKLSAHHKNRTQDVGIRERSQRNKIKTVRYQDTPIDKATKMKLTKWNSREVNTLIEKIKQHGSGDLEQLLDPKLYKSTEQ